MSIGCAPKEGSDNLTLNTCGIAGFSLWRDAIRKIRPERNGKVSPPAYNPPIDGRREIEAWSTTDRGTPARETP